MPLYRKASAAALTASRCPLPTRGERPPDLVGRDQQHDETVVGVERREVRVPGPLQIALSLDELGERVEMAAARPHGRAAVGLITAVIVLPSATGIPSSRPSSLTSSASRAIRSRPRSGCCCSRPRKITTAFTFDPSAKKLERAVPLPRVVVRTDLRSQLELLQGDVHLIPLRCTSFALLLVAPLAVVEDAADRRVRVRRHLDEIEVARVCMTRRLFGTHDSELSSILGDQPHRPVADLFVDPRGDAPVLRDGATFAGFSQPESFLELKRERSGSPVRQGRL